MATDDIIIDGKQFYLMEHQVYRDRAQGVILDAYGKMVVENVRNSMKRQNKRFMITSNSR